MSLKHDIVSFVLLAATLLPGSACAADFEIIGEFYIRGLSDDGSVASGSTSDGTVSTMGRWTNGVGWEQAIPPLPPGGSRPAGCITPGPKATGEWPTPAG